MNSHYTTTTKPPSAPQLKLSWYDCVQLFGTLTVTFYFYILFRAFIELQDGIKIRKVVQAKNILTNFARATVTKSFQMTSGNTFITNSESLPDTRLGLLESRRVALSSHSYSNFMVLKMCNEMCSVFALPVSAITGLLAFGLPNANTVFPRIVSALDQYPPSNSVRTVCFCQ